MRRALPIALAIASLLVDGSAAAALGPPSPATSNRITDGSATEGLGPWESSGFVVNRAWQASTPEPLAGTALSGPAPVFEATTGGATLSQTDSLSDLASAIDAGTQRLWFYSQLGGAGAGADGAYVTLQFLNVSNEPLGQPVQYGPATPGDRLDATMIVPCDTALDAPIEVPVGARAVRVTVAAKEAAGQTNSGLVTDMGLYDQPPGNPLVETLYPPGQYLWVSGGEGPQCGHAELVTIVPGRPHAVPEDRSQPAEASKPPTARPEAMARISALRLTPVRFSLRVSRPAMIHVTITRESADSAETTPHGRDRRLVLMLHARRAGLVAHRLQHKLRPGRYTVVVRLSTGSSKPGGSGRLTKIVTVH
jgi:hypothetical protein